MKRVCKETTIWPRFQQTKWLFKTNCDLWPSQYKYSQTVNVNFVQFWKLIRITAQSKRLPADREKSELMYSLPYLQNCSSTNRRQTETECWQSSCKSPGVVEQIRRTSAGHKRRLKLTTKKLSKFIDHIHLLFSDNRFWL